MEAKRKPLPPWRFYLVSAVLCCLLGLLVWRVLSLQILDMERGHEFLQDQGAMRSVLDAMMVVVVVVAFVPAWCGVSGAVDKKRT